MKQLFPVLAIAMAVSACSSDSSSGSKEVKFDPIATPVTSAPVADYSFTSAFDSNESSVSYTGQTARQLLILDLNSKIKTYIAKDANADVVADMAVFLDGPTEAVNYTYTAKDASGATLPTIPGPTYGDISTGKKLRNKIAGNDPDHLVNNRHMYGWTEGMDSDPMPAELVDYFVELLNTEVTSSTQATVETIGGTQSVGAPYVDGKGRDFSQLLQKLLWGAVTFSQGTADYLKTDFASKNSRDGTKFHTSAEHKWDEAFGYFGAARNYAAYTDAEISSKKSNNYFDADAATINLTSELNFANSVNCGKRDKGSTTSTDYTKQAFDAFLTGRKVLNDAAGSGSISEADASTLASAGKQAAQVWEQCIAATVVHYINDTNADLQAFIDGQGKFADVAAYRDLAKHWSEMKGFALGLQFNPESPFHKNEETWKVYQSILDGMGHEPDFSSATAAEAYKAKLTAARELMQNAYHFDASDVADW